jgi:hypothetical protein
MSLPARKQKLIVYLIWAGLVSVALWALFAGRWSSALVAAATLALTFVPFVFEDFYEIKIPVGFTAAIIAFIFATLFLGEVGNFYERYWWWDIFLHTGSAIGFGLIGFVVMLILLKGDKLAAPPLVVAMFSFCFAVSIGGIWEIFEFAMDQLFGLNMQKSGLIDTMYDLIVDTLGAFIGAAAGYCYLKGWNFGSLSAVIEEFVALNRRLFGKSRNND